MFEDIIGHERVKKQLLRAMESSRIAHAYLFTGPEGIGKKKTALAFAAAINCASGQGGDGCSSCRKIEKENHPDVEVICADGQFIKIERIRKLIDELSYKPYEGRKKIAVLDDAEKLTLQAMNTLLKTLEEPQGEKLLILVTSRPQALLPTVRSRCQEIFFHPLSDTELQLLVRKKKGVDASLAAWIAAFSEGAARKALDVDPIAYRKKREELLHEISRLDEKDIVSLFALSERLTKDKIELAETLEMLLNGYRECLQEQREPVGLRILREAIEHIQTTMDMLKRNVNARLAMDNLLLFLAKERIEAGYKKELTE
jgi:DNA polymerase-3 subunit delta'